MNHQEKIFPKIIAKIEFFLYIYLKIMASIHLQLCFSFVSTGQCPYGNKCTYIHDKRLESRYKEKNMRCRNKNRSLYIDTFFWPNSLNSDIYLPPWSRYVAREQLIWKNFCQVLKN